MYWGLGNMDILLFNLLTSVVAIRLRQTKDNAGATFTAPQL